MSGAPIREISGRTRVLFILADPVTHVRTPQAINALAARRRVDCVMTPCEVSAQHLSTVVLAMRAMKSVDGAVITAPHKRAAAALCDELSKQASAVGAVNTIRRTPQGALLGDNFDGLGMIAGLATTAPMLEGECVYMVGAGGVASAIAFALAEAGVRKLVIRNRTQDKACRLADAIKVHFPAIEILVTSSRDPSGARLVINSSTLGMHPEDPLPLDVERLTTEMTVADVVMQPSKTALLLEAERRGCRVQPGHVMLEHQLALIATFLGVTAGAAPPL